MNSRANLVIMKNFLIAPAKELKCITGMLIEFLETVGNAVSKEIKLQSLNKSIKWILN